MQTVSPSHVPGTHVAVVCTMCTLHVCHWAVTGRSSHQVCKLEDSEVQTFGLRVPQCHGHGRGQQGRTFAVMSTAGECWSWCPSPLQSPRPKPLAFASPLMSCGAPAPCCCSPQHGEAVEERLVSVQFSACLWLGPKVNLPKSPI